MFVVSAYSTCLLLFRSTLHVAVCVFRGTWRRPSTRTTSTTRVASSCRTSTTTPTSCSSRARCGTVRFPHLTQRIKLVFFHSSFFPLYFVLTPSSRYVFCARTLLNILSIQPVLHDWCNKGHGMCYPVCGMVHIKEPLLSIEKSSLCGGSRFPLSLSEWSFTICPTPYNRR